MNPIVRLFRYLFGYGEHMRRNVWAVVTLLSLPIFIRMSMAWSVPIVPVFMYLVSIASIDRHWVRKYPIKPIDVWATLSVIFTATLTTLAEFRPEHPGVIYGVVFVANLVVMFVAFWKWKSEIV